MFNLEKTLFSFLGRPESCVSQTVLAVCSCLVVLFWFQLSFFLEQVHILDKLVVRFGILLSACIKTCGLRPAHNRGMDRYSLDNGKNYFFTSSAEEVRVKIVFIRTPVRAVQIHGVIITNMLVPTMLSPAWGKSGIYVLILCIIHPSSCSVVNKDNREKESMLWRYFKMQCDGMQSAAVVKL